MNALNVLRDIMHMSSNVGKSLSTLCDDYEHDTGRCLSCYEDH